MNGVKQDAGNVLNSWEKTWLVVGNCVDSVPIKMDDVVFLISNRANAFISNSISQA